MEGLWWGRVDVQKRESMLASEKRRTGKPGLGTGGHAVSPGWVHRGQKSPWPLFGREERATELDRSCREGALPLDQRAVCLSCRRKQGGASFCAALCSPGYGWAASAGLGKRRACLWEGGGVQAGQCAGMWRGWGLGPLLPGSGPTRSLGHLWTIGEQEGEGALEVQACAPLTRLRGAWEVGPRGQRSAHSEVLPR